MTAPSGPPEFPWTGPTQPWGPGPQPGWVHAPGVLPPAAPTAAWGTTPGPRYRPVSGAGAVATGLTYLAGVMSAGFALAAWTVLLFAQTLVNRFDSSGFGYPRSSGGLGDSGTDLALGIVLLIGIAALCFVGAARFSALGRSGLAYAGTICVLISLLIGSVGSGGGGWSLLLAPVPIGALIALLACRVKPGDPAR